MNENTIRVVVEEDSYQAINAQNITLEGSKIGIDIGGSFWAGEPEESKPQVFKTKVADIKVEKLEQEMLRLVEVVNRLCNLPNSQVNNTSGMHLDEIELAVEINGEGQISIIGNGAKAGAKGAIKLKFKRTEIK